jgi:2,5-diamino-6-(ribosylamino)-4(3H)-pyrimidinone 5'-phosphate reductase
MAASTASPPTWGLYYELAARLPHQAVLTGSGTLLAAAASQGIDMAGEDPPPPPGAPPQPPAREAAAAPLLLVVDSRGQCTRYAWLRHQPFWRDLLVLCSAATPAGQISRLRRHQVGHVVLGTDRVDLAAALRMLTSQHQVTAVRVDAGGGLNGALLRAGLADEISVVIAPYLAGGSSPPRLIAGTDSPAALAVRLTHTERLRNGHIWLRYAVTVPADPGRHDSTELPDEESPEVDS